MKVFLFEYAKKYLSDTNPIIIPDALFSWYSLINDSHKVTNGKYYLAHAAESDEYYECLDFTKPYIFGIRIIIKYVRREYE